MASRDVKHELCQLLGKVEDGCFLPEDVARIEQLTGENPELVAAAAGFAALCGMLDWMQLRPQGSNITPKAKAEPTLPPSHAAIFVARAGDGTTGFFSSGWPVAYLIATVILGITLVVGTLVHVTQPTQLAGQLPSVAQDRPSLEPETPVGRITGMADCRWIERNAEVACGDYVPLGQEFALASGYLEITYDTGAKVILQGPCTYVVESKQGGFLSLGKLTARVEAKGTESEAKGERTANLHLHSLAEKVEPTTSLAPRPSPLIPEHYPLSATHYPLFTVCTPTAIVTDLGTEFGVEVTKSGASRANVFRGEIELRVVDGDTSPVPSGSKAAGESRSRVVRLRENESVRVERDANRHVTLIREAGWSNARTFVRQMPRQAPIELFNTGVGLKEGDPDPHWQVVARSDDPHFQPRPAVVTAVGPGREPNNPAVSQWISIGNGPPALPNGVTVTFRTMCLVRAALRPGGITPLSLHVWEYKHVTAIRVNASGGRGGEQGLHQGVNCVEFDVTTEDPSHAAGASPVLLRVTWVERRVVP